MARFATRIDPIDRHPSVWLYLAICTVVWDFGEAHHTYLIVGTAPFGQRRRIEGNGSLGAVTSKRTQVLCWLLFLVWLPATSQAHPLSVRPVEVRTDRLRFRARTATTLRVGVPSARCRSSITTRPSIRSAACTKRCSACNATASQSLPTSARLPGLHADIHQRKMGANCAQCHTVQGWNIAVQQVKDHQNRFPLLGAHAAVQCEDCHKSAAVGQYQGLSTACSSCHMRDFQQAKSPDHVAGQFPQTCDSCTRLTVGWAPA